MDQTVTLAPSVAPIPQRRQVREFRLSDVVGGLSRALDLTEGQSPGHAQRTVLIGMRIAYQVGLDATSRASLFYGLLLKDSGCTKSASRTAALFGRDDIALRQDGKLVDFGRPREALGYLLRNSGADSRGPRRARKALQAGRALREAAPEIVAARCQQGANVVRALGLDHGTAETIVGLDEHWDGGGYPEGLVGEQIPLLARIGCLAQSVDAFLCAGGRAAAHAMVEDRRGRWFDPDLADIVLGLSEGDPLWDRLSAAERLADSVRALEPTDRVIHASEEHLDRVAEAFALVVDAKSPWTNLHSHRVAQVATAAARQLGMPDHVATEYRRVALLHDVGKLAVSSHILDKPGRLTDDEFAQIKRHAVVSEQILAGIALFAPWATTAGAHHERLDGSGYPRGLTGRQIPRGAQVLAVADVYDALTAERPYRDAMSRDNALSIIRAELDTAFSPEAYGAVVEVTRAQ